MLDGSRGNRFDALVDCTEEIDSDSSVSEGEENLYTDHIRKYPSPEIICSFEPRVTRARNLALEAALTNSQGLEKKVKGQHPQQR